MKKKRKPLLSIGIIFRNEIRCMERCLKSLKPLRDAIPCELVMADTGSEDGTREIVEKYADILIDFPWVNDFAAARNAVLDRSSGEWFMTLDADEWIDPEIGKLVEFLQIKQRMYHLAGYTIRNFKTPNVTDDDNYQDFYAMRIMRNGIGVRYEGCIHERWKYPETLHNPQTVRLDMLVYHDGYAFIDKASMQAKHDRNMKLLEKKLEENPEDLQTLAECMDMVKNEEEDGAYYARRSLEILHRDWEQWGTYGARVYRDAITIAKLQKLQEMPEWVDKAEALFSDSIYTRVDIHYCAFSWCWDHDDTEGAVRWAEKYRKGLADYRAGDFDRSELFRGLLEFSSPFWERRMLIMQIEGYLRLGEYEKAFSCFGDINGAGLDEVEQVEACTNMLLRLHRESALDTGALMTGFWKQLNQPKPDQKIAGRRRKTFLNTAAAALTPYYRVEEEKRDTFKRHSYTALLPLEGVCILGDGAAVLEMVDPDELEQKLRTQKLEDFPISAFAHALQCKMDFPFSGPGMTLEQMDAIASRLIPLEVLMDLCMNTVKTDLQHVCWRRALLLACIKSCKWEKEDTCLLLARGFAEFEKQFLSLCYTETLRSEEGVFLLPPMHRFGWYCAQAFDALDAGDAVSYTRLLRKGLESCGDVKPMVEFLLEHTPELANARQSEPSEELKNLAEQVRTILSAYAPEDPAVVLLKQSEAYQKVAYLIDGTAAQVKAGVLQ